MAKFRKKPVEIEARLFDGSGNSATDIIEWALSHSVSINYACELECRSDSHTLRISTLEGAMTAQPGDYVIMGLQGEFYPCKPDIFEASYDEV